jgi:hypothetical protein
MQYLRWLQPVAELLTDEKTAANWIFTLPPIEKASVKTSYPHVVKGGLYR